MERYRRRIDRGNLNMVKNLRELGVRSNGRDWDEETYKKVDKGFVKV